MENNKRPAKKVKQAERLQLSFNDRSFNAELRTLKIEADNLIKLRETITTLTNGELTSITPSRMIAYVKDKINVPNVEQALKLYNLYDVYGEAVRVQSKGISNLINPKTFTIDEDALKEEFTTYVEGKALEDLKNLQKIEKLLQDIPRELALCLNLKATPISLDKERFVMVHGMINR